MRVLPGQDPPALEALARFRGDAIRSIVRPPSRWPARLALIAALAAILVGTTASATAAVGAETRVGALNVAGQDLVEPPEHVSAGQRLGEAAPRAKIVVATGVAAKAGPEIAEGSGRLFVTSGRGVTYDIPKGWGQRMADNGRGLVFQRGGASGNADMIRVMEPTAKYQNGYVRVYNSLGQPLDVFGKPGPASATHISQDYMGQWPGWPQ